MADESEAVEMVPCDHTKQRYEDMELPCSLPFCDGSPDVASFALLKHFPNGAIEEIEFKRCFYETASQSHYFYWVRL